MKTRNAGGDKSEKKTPAVRKSASKTKASPSVETPKAGETKRTPARAARQVKKTETTPVSSSKRRRSSGEDEFAGSPASVVRRTSGRVRTPATTTSVYVSAHVEYAKMKGKAMEEASVEGDVMAVVTSENVPHCDPVELEGSVIEEDRVEKQDYLVDDIVKSMLICIEEVHVEKKESVVEEIMKSSENVLPSGKHNPLELERSVIEEVPPCGTDDPDGEQDSIVKNITKSSESMLICGGEDHVEKKKSVVEEVTHSSESILPCDGGGDVEEVKKFSESHPPYDEEDHVEKTESIVEEVTKSSESIPPCDEGGVHVEEVEKSSECHPPCGEEDPDEKQESLVEDNAKSPESMLVCVKEVHNQKNESVAEEYTKYSEGILPYDEGGLVEKIEYVVEELARSSKKEPPCDIENRVEIEESVTNDDTKSVETELPCDTRQSVVEKLTRNLEIETSCAEKLHNNIEVSIAEVVIKSSENVLSSDVRERMGAIAEHEESKDGDTNEVTCSESASKVETDEARLHSADTDLAKKIYDVEYGEKLDLKEHGEEELAGDNAKEHEEESMNLKDEREQLTAISKERKIKKEREVFLDGLDPDVEEEDVRRVFEIIGGIVEVRMQRNPSNNKNKGYAFVEFINKELASRALDEMKNPVIRGKICRTSPSEDNTTLFIGNICNTWTKEAIKQKLQDYEVESVENISLVSDVQREGLSRGFAFVEFSCHWDAMLAYKRLQQPDVIFGHPEWTAKVGFAEHKCEPDPEVMSQVKSIFVDGLPPHWHEKQVREKFECYGEIVRVVLARNMSRAKRKDFGFVDFSSHESAVASVNVINNTQFGDENLKINLKARLSNPLPITRAVKDGVRGGFRIGSSVSRLGRDSGRTRHAINLANYQPAFHGRGGQMGFSRSGQFSSGGGSGVASPSPRFYVDRPSLGASNIGRAMMKKAAVKFRPSAHMRKLKAVAEEALQKKVDDHGNLVDVVGSVIYRTPACGRDGKLLSPRGDVVEKRLSEDTPFQPSDLGDHSHGATLAREAPSEDVGALQSAAAGGDGAMEVAAVRRAFVSAGLGAKGAADTNAAGPKRKRKGGEEGSRKKKMSALRPAALAIRDAVPEVYPINSGASDQSAQHSVADFSIVGAPTGTLKLELEVAPSSPHLNAPLGGSQPAVKAEQGFRVPSWFDSCAYDPKIALVGTSVHLELSHITPTAFDYGFKALAQQTLTSGLKERSEVRRAAVLAVHAANSMFHVAATEEALYAEKQKYELLRREAEEKKEKLDSLRAELGEANDKLLAAQRELLHQIESHKVIQEQYNEDYANLEAKLEKEQVVRAKEKKELEDVVGKAAENTVEAFLVSKEAKELEEKVKAEGVAEFLASPDYKVRLEEAYKLAVADYLASPSCANKLEQAREQAVIDFRNSEAYCAELAKNRRRGYERGIEYNLGFLRHLGAVNEARHNVVVDDEELVNAYPEDPFTADLVMSDVEEENTAKDAGATDADDAGAAA